LGLHTRGPQTALKLAFGYAGIMRYPSLAELRELSATDRLRLTEDVWATFIKTPESLPFTEEHRRIVDSRFKEWQNNPDAGSSWEEVRRRITK
jgi:putative addiction module component (TIGR02574 family)